MPSNVCTFARQLGSLQKQPAFMAKAVSSEVITLINLSQQSDTKEHKFVQDRLLSTIRKSNLILWGTVSAMN